jgi:hypothetical protein
VSFIQTEERSAPSLSNPKGSTYLKTLGERGGSTIYREKISSVETVQKREPILMERS